MMNQRTMCSAPLLPFQEDTTELSLDELLALSAQEDYERCFYPNICAEIEECDLDAERAYEYDMEEARRGAQDFPDYSIEHEGHPCHSRCWCKRFLISELEMYWDSLDPYEVAREDQRIVDDHHEDLRRDAQFELERYRDLGHLMPDEHGRLG